MQKFIPKNLLKLADACRDSLFVVGGSVRDFLCGYSPTAESDWDICSPCEESVLLDAARRCGFTVRSVYRNTGTVKLTDPDGVGYEFTRFRSDKYVRGLHKPEEITFTRDVVTDAKRRDFCANAVYYDLKRNEFVDPLGGIGDVERKILRTVAPAEKVFGEDGLRLMRLCRFAAQTGFSPDEECLEGARRNGALIRDIVPERIFAELVLLLGADRKHGVYDGPYRGLQLLRETGVLNEIMPELAAGDGMAQRSDFHKYDVLEHSFRCVLYSPPEIRFAALLHDVGKPFCMLKDGNVHEHPQEGARIAEEILTRLKAPKKLKDETVKLIFLHMRDYNLQMREGKLRRELVLNSALLPRLLALKQADYSACKDDLSTAPGVEKWHNVLEKMKREGVPLTLSQLAVNGAEVQAAGVKPQDTARALSELLLYCAENGKRNNKQILLARAEKLYREDGLWKPRYP